MKEVKIKSFSVATDIRHAIAEAKKETTEHLDIYFRFNGVDVKVSNTTDAGLLYRDYTVAHLAGWKEIGPDCDYIWPSELMFKMAEKKRELETSKRSNIPTP